VELLNRYVACLCISLDKTDFLSYKSCEMYSEFD
jgi:hypothetical protein